MSACMSAWFVACSPSSLVDVAPPSTVVDPSATQNTTAATELYRFAVTYFDQRFGGDNLARGNGSLVGTSAIFTDELQSAGNGTSADQFDSRNVSIVRPSLGTGTSSGGLYNALHQPRNAAAQAREALRLYAPSAPVAWQGQLYALEAYTMVYFAELFCSGIPMTKVPLNGAPQLSAGLSTQQILAQAIVLFDSAMTVGADSARFVNLAKVGKGRALLALGRFTDAAAAVQGVPTDFAYQATFSGTVGQNNVIGGGTRKQIQVVDNEGGTGLVWSTDPRTATMTSPALSGAMKVSAKYSLTSAGILDASIAAPAAPIHLADGVEARLIEAEADLAAGGTAWLTILNTLRSTCVAGATCAPLPASVNLPHPLTAGSLPPLADPGTPDARLDTLMKERAMWLYLTGHREGDLRRLAHVYHRDPTTLWPKGIYHNAGFPPAIGIDAFNGTTYGNDYVFSPSTTEAINNPLYTGCINGEP